jgi:hypothetical protein
MERGMSMPSTPIGIKSQEPTTIMSQLLTKMVDQTKFLDELTSSLGHIKSRLDPGSGGDPGESEKRPNGGGYLGDMSSNIDRTDAILQRLGAVIKELSEIL